MTGEPLDTVDRLGTILSVWAHPDDETYLAAGTMAAAADLGNRVVCVSATAGELGTPDPRTWPPERLGRRRRWEAAAAMAVLGVADHRILGLPDGALPEHEDEGLAMIRRLLDEVDPDTILTFGPDGMTFHSDHIAVHRWVTTAWRERGCRGRLLYATPTVEHLARFGALYEEWGAYMTDERPVGTPVDELALHVVLDGPDLDRKVTALSAMASQTWELVAIDPEIYALQAAEESFVAAAAPPPSGRESAHSPIWAGILPTGERDPAQIPVSGQSVRRASMPAASVADSGGTGRSAAHAGIVSL